MRPARTADELRARARVRAARAGSDPLADYDPGYFDQLGTRGDSTTIAVRGIPAGWSPCDCGRDHCPDRGVPR